MDTEYAFMAVATKNGIEGRNQKSNTDVDITALRFSFLNEADVPSSERTA